MNHGAQEVVQNYVDKMRWVGCQRMPIFVHIQGKKCPRRGSQKSEICARSYSMTQTSLWAPVCKE